MERFRRVLLALFIASILFLSGCITLDVKQKIRGDGNSEIEVVYDLSAMFGMAKGMEVSGEELNMSEFEKNFMQTCTKFYEETKWENAKCRTTEEHKLIMSGKVSLKDNPAFKVSRSIPYTTYRYDVKDVYNTISSVGETQGQEFSDEQLQQTESVVGAMGMKLRQVLEMPTEEDLIRNMSELMKLRYVLEMPGKITKADVGEIKDNQVKIDIFDLTGKEHVYVESQELNLLWDAGAAIIIMLIIAAALILRKRGRAS